MTSRHSPNLFLEVFVETTPTHQPFIPYYSALVKKSSDNYISALSHIFNLYDNHVDMAHGTLIITQARIAKILSF